MTIVKALQQGDNSNGNRRHRNHRSKKNRRMINTASFVEQAKWKEKGARKKNQKLSKLISSLKQRFTAGESEVLGYRIEADVCRGKGVF